MLQYLRMDKLVVVNLSQWKEMKENLILSNKLMKTVRELFKGES